MVGEYEIDHREYGGLISPGDFDKKTYMSDVASQIAAADSFNRTNKTLSKYKRKKTEE